MIKWTLEVVVLTTLVVLTTPMIVEEDWMNKFDPFLLDRELDQDFPFLQPFSKDMKDDYPACEVPKKSANTKLTLKFKNCNYRGRNYADILYKFITGQQCFYFAQPASCDPVNKPQIGTCKYKDIGYAPCFYIPVFNESISLCYPIDSDTPEVIREIERTMANKQAVDKWRRCAKAAMECCDNSEDTPDQNTCSTIWDAWGCWSQGIGGKNSTQVCPEFAYSNQGPVCNHYSYKFCNITPTGTAWIDKTDYSTCTVTPRLLLRNEIHVTLLAISVGICTPAVIIMLAYKRLRTERLAMHRNLLIFIIIRNVLIIIIKTVIIEDELTTAEGMTIMTQNGFWCKFLTIMEKLAASSTFMCMLVDGIFLHRRIVNVFKKSFNLIIVYSTAAAITIIPVVIWIALMAVYNDSNCWIVYDTQGIQWILDVPRICILLANTVLLVDILRVIMTKLNKQENANQLSTARATLFLMPLFGVQFLLTAWRPQTGSCPWEQTYYVFTYVMDSLQGIMVSVLYCYWNTEVHNLIKVTYKKTENVVSTHFTKGAQRRRATQANMSNRRDTYSTMVDTDSRPSIYITDTSNRDHQATPSNLPADEEPAAQIFGSSFYSASNDGLIEMHFEHDSYPPQQDYSYNSRTFEHEIEEMSGYGHHVDLWIKDKSETNASFDHDSQDTNNNIIQTHL
ncbi:calcitonin gene-related peptide type 1 receptor-like [Arctopsyche grandis]|uniref:calcitonin gene-related peptide type 1 receptor-like n=1 Tax=Arctopsyche grandis TaxID=121162 RepID=UPI00406D9F39